jgi:hypothetical protein
MTASDREIDEAAFSGHDIGRAERTVESNGKTGIFPLLHITSLFQ